MKESLDSGGEEEEEEKVEEDNKKISSNLILRKSTRSKNKPKYLEDFTVLAFCAESFVENVSELFNDIHKRDDKEQ